MIGKIKEIIIDVIKGIFEEQVNKLKFLSEMIMITALFTLLNFVLLIILIIKTWG
jgi:hypothetical protein